jgi:hypothetical protein
MKYTFQYKISLKDIEQFNQNEFDIPNVVFDFIPKSKETLLKILIPNFSANIYSVIKNQKLVLDEKLCLFFSSLQEEEIVFIAINSKYNSENDINFEIHFSKVFDFSDLKIENFPIISAELISQIKELTILA